MSSALKDESMTLGDTDEKTTRVTLREIREHSFRAVRTTGASGAEARVAAEQALFAELHHGNGLAAVLEDLSSGPWDATELSCVPADSSGVTLVRSTAGRRGPLRQGAALIELMAAEPQVSVVVSDGLSPLSCLLDEPLIRAAASLGRCVSAWARGAHTVEVRTALPDGTLGVGTAQPSGPAAEQLDGWPGGTVVLHSDEHPPTGQITWLRADELQARRRAAAASGITVDATVWERLGALARNFLVPEQ